MGELLTLEAAIAVSRFGFGARQGDIAGVGDALGWLRSQLGRRDWLPPPSAMPSAGSYLAELPRNLQQQPNEKKLAIAKRSYEIQYAEIAYRLAAAIHQPDGFRERLVWFWSNHFTVSSTNGQARAFLGSFEREAIRPNILGRFDKLLLAVVRHPGMLIYLDNVSNLGPNSRAGRVTGRGLNENLAREILELHTLGVDGGYTQQDVTEFAKILTGWSVSRSGGDNGFEFYANRHEPGPKTLLAESYNQRDGEEEGILALKRLAVHPSTARFIATKLARHFFADHPSPDQIARLERVWRETEGDLAAVSNALLEDPAAFAPKAAKFRPPAEFVVAATRAVMPAMSNALLQTAEDALSGRLTRKEMKGARQLTPGIALIESTRIMGQFPFAAPSPKGWPDENAAWIAPDPVLERVEWCSQIGAKIPLTMAPADLADDLLGTRLAAETRRAIELAASPAQGLALLLASPEFQER